MATLTPLFVFSSIFVYWYFYKMVRKAKIVERAKSFTSKKKPSFLKEMGAVNDGALDTTGGGESDDDDKLLNFNEVFNEVPETDCGF